MIKKLLSTMCRFKFSTEQMSNPKYQSTVYTFEVINHFDQISKCKGQGGSISVMPCYPQYQVNKNHTIAIKMKYSRNFIYLWRFQLPQDSNAAQQTNREALNFPVSYDNCAILLDMVDNCKENPQLTLEESTAKGTLHLTIQIDYETKKVSYQINQQFKETNTVSNTYKIDISVAQFKLLTEQMKQGLPIVTGWQVPSKFLSDVSKSNYQTQQQE